MVDEIRLDRFISATVFRERFILAEADFYLAVGSSGEDEHEALQGQTGVQKSHRECDILSYQHPRLLLNTPLSALTGGNICSGNDHPLQPAQLKIQSRY